MKNRACLAWALPALMLLPCSCGGGSNPQTAPLAVPGAGSESTPSTHAQGVPALLDGFTGLPDTLAIHGTSNSGVFLDLVSDPTHSESIKQPAHYTIVVPPGKTNLRVYVFDGNCSGLWDQNQLAYGTGDSLLADGSAVEYRLTTDGAAAGTPVLVALGESPRPTQGVGVTKVFTLDDEWEALYDGALPSAASSALPDGSHRYSLDVKYVVDASDAINGYKVAVDGRIRIAPSTGSATVIGGFIGGVVDSREMHFNFPGNGPKTSYATSRDWYPNLLTPPASLNDLCTDASVFRPAVLHPAPQAFVNTYDGSFDVPIDLAPAAGQTWESFATNLILEEGDADDASDTLPTTPAGTQNPGIPPDDGQPYPIGNPTRDSSGYRLPVAAAPSVAGSPWLEVVDPSGVVRATVHDLSGNVTQAPAGGSGANQGWERIPIPTDYAFDPSNVTWKLRMHNLDARNTWFIRSNVKVPEVALGAIGDRVWMDAQGVCNGTQDATGPGATDEHGVNGVSVTLYAQVGANLVPVTPPAGATWANPQLTHDLPAGGAFDSPSGSFGTAGYYLFDQLPVPPGGATYVVRVDASNFLPGGPLAGATRTFPATDSGTATLSTASPFDRSIDFGYCKTEQPGRIGDRVWADELGVCNGVQDPTGAAATAEHGVNGVSVTLYTQVGASLVPVPVPAGATWTNPQLTHDLPVGGAFQSPSGAFGTAGYYLFDKLPAPAAGVTYVAQVDASNFLAGGPLFGYDRTFPATPTSSTTLSQAKLDDFSVDFGYCKKLTPGRIGDRVWIDELNVCNGVQDPTGASATAEHGVNGVSVTLYTQVGASLVPVPVPAGATWTNPQLTHDLPAGGAFQSPTGAFGTAGYYLFDNLPAPVAGTTYVVGVDASNFAAGGMLAGYDRTFPATPTSSTTLSQSKLDDFSLDFGYCKTVTEQPGSIGDRVWADASNVCNGLQDPTGPSATDEHGVNGVSVTLFAQVGATLVPVVPPAGATWTNPQLTHDLPAGGAFQSPSGAFGTAGYYLFDKLPAPAAGITYVVQVDASNFVAGGALFGYDRTFPASPTGTTTLSQAKLSDFSLDFGYCKTELPGRIGDRVWVDAQNVCNGIEDPTGPSATDEHGVNGVSVTLFLQSGGLLLPVTPPAGAAWTNPQLTHDLPAGGAFQSPSGAFGAAGYYLFDHLPAPAAGATYVVVIDASNFLAGGPLFGYDRTFPATPTASTTLSQGKLDDFSLDFGFCKTVQELPGSIGDRVWMDETNVCNGVQDSTGAGDSAEHGVNGVSVTLIRQDGDALSIVTPPAGATWTNPQLTHDLPAGGSFQSPSGVFGTAGYYLFDKLPAPAAGQIYWVQVDGSNFLPGGALFGADRTFPASLPATTTLSQGKLADFSLDFGYCRKETPGSLGDRVWIDARHVCNGIQDPTGPGVDDEHGVNGVAVTLFAQLGDVLVPVTPPPGATWTNPQLTHDLPPGTSFGSPAGPFGTAGYYFFDMLPAPAAGATYVVQVNAENFLPGGPLEGYARAIPGTVSTTLSPSNLVDLSLDFGYCRKECECQSGKVHQLCLEASVWVGDACSNALDVYVKLDRGCPTCTPDGSPSPTSTMVDLLTFTTDGPLSGEQVGANGLITVKDVKTVDGYAKVLVCLEANCPYFPNLYFDGDIHLEVTVNGVGEAFCAPIDCHCLQTAGVFPCDWQPLWCGDVPDFHVLSFVPWECVPHPECRPPPPPCCKPPTCDVPPPPPPTCPPTGSKGSDDRRRRG